MNGSGHSGGFHTTRNPSTVMATAGDVHPSNMAACTREEYWYYYIAISLVTFFGGLVILVPAHYLWYHCYTNRNSHVSKRYRNRRERRFLNCFARIRAAAAELLSGQTTASKLLIVTVFLFNMTSVGIYLVDASEFTVTRCVWIWESPKQMLDMGLNAIFLLYFFIRFAASFDKLFFWVEVYTIIDHFTIGPALMGIYLGRNWIGLRFLRILYLMSLPDVLQYLRILRYRSTIRLAQIICIFIGIWLTCSGLMHLVENTGDPFHNYNNAHVLTYWNCVYWLLVTMSTVGFGEITPKTDIGKVVIVIFIMGSFVLFTSVIPELVEGLGRKGKYKKPYKRTYGKSHVVVCGRVTYDAVSRFIKNFIHQDTGIQNTNVVFIDSITPDLEVEALFKRYFSVVSFYDGTVMDINDLKNVKVNDAEACLILADRNSNDPDEEDAANIMRATAVKNFNPHTRVIIQLLQSQNKTYLLHIPGWDWNRGDDAVCVSQLKLGIMAQNCLAPGIATLISNLFTMRSFKMKRKSKCWQDNYQLGAGNEIYAESFSKVFYGMSFPRAAEVCFVHFNVLLVGLSINGDQNKSTLRVNPGSDVFIDENSEGFFIAQSYDVVKRVSTYVGHPFVISDNGFSKNGLAIGLQNGQSNNNGGIIVPEKSTAVFAIAGPDLSEETDDTDEISDIGSSNIKIPPSVSRYGNRRPSHVALEFLKSHTSQAEVVDLFDFTGMFHWCPGRTIQDCIMSEEAIKSDNLRNHVVVCLMSDDTSPHIGLANFVMPLRATSYRFEELKDIVIIGDPSYLEREWADISNFPKIHVHPGRATNIACLRAVNVNTCDMCVILSARKPLKVDQILVDKEAILCNLNMKSLSGENLSNMLENIGEEISQWEFGKDIPVTTELEIDSNVQFLEHDDEDDPDTPLYLTHPFACGKTFASSALDALVTTTYCNGDVLRLIRALITGGENAEFEHILMEGLGIVPKDRGDNINNPRNRSRIVQLSLCEAPFTFMRLKEQYGSVFVAALRDHGMLCLGLYRYMFPDNTEDCSLSRKRCVITNPPHEFPLLSSDRVFCLQPYPREHLAGRGSFEPRDANRNLSLKSRHRGGQNNRTVSESEAQRRSREKHHLAGPNSDSSPSFAITVQQ